MNTGKSILFTTALATLLAGAVSAQTTTDPVADTTETVGDAVTDTGEAVADTLSDTGEAVDDALTNTARTADDMIDGMAAEGEVVLSADAESLGTVQSVETLANGQTAVVIDVDESLGLPVEHVKVAATTSQDGAYEIALSRAEFVSAVNAQVSARTN